jgi:hypothetical protein
VFHCGAAGARLLCCARSSAQQSERPIPADNVTNSQAVFAGTIRTAIGGCVNGQHRIHNWRVVRVNVVYGIECASGTHTLLFAKTAWGMRFNAVKRPLARVQVTSRYPQCEDNRVTTSRIGASVCAEQVQADAADRPQPLRDN